jgi:hypothetical protein
MTTTNPLKESFRKRLDAGKLVSKFIKGITEDVKEEYPKSAETLLQRLEDRLTDISDEYMSTCLLSTRSHRRTPKKTDLLEQFDEIYVEVCSEYPADEASNAEYERHLNSASKEEILDFLQNYSIQILKRGSELIILDVDNDGVDRELQNGADDHTPYQPFDVHEDVYHVEINYGDHHGEKRFIGRIIDHKVLSRDQLLEILLAKKAQEELCEQLLEHWEMEHSEAA